MKFREEGLALRKEVLPLQREQMQLLLQRLKQKPLTAVCRKVKRKKPICIQMSEKKKFTVRCVVL